MTEVLTVDDKCEDRVEDMAQKVLGTPADRPEGLLKVTGQATYAAEDLPEGCAFGILVRAPGHGSVAVPNAAEVGEMPGVLAVLRDPRMIRNSAQGAANEAPVQGVDKADYVGQPVALVVAESLETARHAAHALTVQTSGKTPPVDPGSVPTEGEPDAQGDLSRAMQEAQHSLDVTYTTPAMTSAPMEPHAAVAWWDEDNLTVRASLQMLKYNRNELGDALGIPPENLRLLSPFVGGGFGSKLGISAETVAAALAARQLDRPVQVVQHRRQMFETVTRRSETRQRIRLAADAEGRLTGIGHEALVSNLPDESHCEPVTQASHFAYGADHRVIGERLARVHRPASGSVRAPGEAVGVSVFECAMDELAQSLNLDPLELRLRNIPKKDPESGKPFSSHELAEALTTGAGHFGWASRNPAPRKRREGEWWIGTGMASAFRVNTMTEAEARIVLDGSGARVETDMTDIGTGTYAILSQIVAEALGLPLSQVTVRLGDTDFPPGSGSGGSFGAATSGGAVWLAALDLRKQLAARAGCAETELRLQDNQARIGNRHIPLTDLLGGTELTGHGHIKGGKAFKSVRQSTFGAHFAEVAVSDITGEVRVRRLLGCFAAGRILNEKTARSQCHGGMAWGVGMALTEGLLHDRRDGHIVNRDLAEYHIPVNADLPEPEVHFLHERDPWSGPLMSKGLGELAICGVAGAVLNAVHHACGVRLRDLPATPDRVLSVLA